MTNPQIGNYGVNPQDAEARRPQVAGFVVKELARRVSNYRSTLTLEDYLAESGIIGLQGVDTRALTKKLRVDGALRAVLSTDVHDPAECVRLARESPGMVGADLVQDVAPRDSYSWAEGVDSALCRRRSAAAGSRRVLAIDCGMKRNILRQLVDTGFTVEVHPPTAAAEAILESKPDGVFVSNGPGDPAAVGYAIELIRKLLGRVPTFGICLGHQLIALALGAQSFKLRFGHRGANQPVRNVLTGRIEITSQNHGFAIDIGSLSGAGGTPTHVNLNDGTLEGFIHADMPILAVQYHPEASPGPHDATYLFDCFATMIATGRSPTQGEMAEAQASASPRSKN
jgi:carbamoyl-phosphate synthase small subunit